ISTFCVSFFFKSFIETFVTIIFTYINLCKIRCSSFRQISHYFYSFHKRINLIKYTKSIYAKRYFVHKKTSVFKMLINIYILLNLKDKGKRRKGEGIREKT